MALSDVDLLEDSLSFAVQNEIEWTRDNTKPWGIHQEDSSPWNRLFGPVFHEEASQV